MRARFKGALSIIFMMIVGLIVLGIFYILYLKYLGGGADIKISGPLSINYVDGSKLKLNGDEEVSFSIINDSEEAAYYFIEFKNPKNIKGKITYTLSNGKDINITDELNNYNTTVSSYNLINGGEIQKFTLKFDSEENFNYSLELNVNVENLETNTFAEVIIKNNDVNDKPVTTPGVEVATTEEGLISSIDDYGTTYYFRGASSNNYVMINNLPFRIVRINGDGTVRLIYDGQLENLTKYYETFEKYDYNRTLVNTTLQNWVTENLEGYTQYLANYKYCNDMNKEDNEFLAMTRLKTDNIPSFVCLGDKVLNKVGILTADELIYAGATLTDNNESFYLYNENAKDSFYTMTSASLSSNAYYLFMLNDKGKVTYSASGGNLGAVRPVINIIKTATVTGSGTVNDPYQLTNE